MNASRRPATVVNSHELSEEQYLRSTNEVTGYHVQATDGLVGQIEDFLVEDAIWAIRYVVVDMRNWLPGEKVLVSTEWFNEVDWGGRTVNVKLLREQIKECPRYDSARLLENNYQEELNAFFGSLLFEDHR